MRDHGGNLDGAIATWGGAAEDWIDLSTGINRVPYPVPDLPPAAWRNLPTRADMARLHRVAQAAYGTEAPLIATAGAQAAIQMVPLLAPRGTARVLGPTYNEHAGALTAAGWQVETVARPEDLSGADLAVVVNPNNPDGRWLDRATLRDLAGRVGRLIVDESFADPMPEQSLAAKASGRLIVLRSFGKFYGLAGLRLGFLIADSATIDTVSALSGPWPISGPAIAIGTEALADRGWANATTARLFDEATRIDQLAARAGWALVGGTPLFRLYDTPDASAAQDRLARAQIWSRIFPYSTRWLRLGLPGGAAEWDRLAQALS